jgi:hypothetical protein
MNDTNAQTVAGHFPTFRRWFGWLFSWRTIRRCLFVLICLLTLVALFYAEEDWRGRRAWNKYRQELEARGEQLDYRTFIPKPVSDDQNFAATPFIKSWFLKENRAPDGQSKLWPDDYMRVGPNVSSLNSTDKGDRHFVNLVAWGTGFDAIRSGEMKPHQEFKSDKQDPESRARAAPAVLEGLKASETNLAELRAASRRPYSRYPVVYDLENPWGILIPHLANVKASCQRLLLRACAELVAGQGENALEDVKLILYLADSVKDEPFLISYLVRLACCNIATQPIWEGLAEHRWSDAQLLDLQTRLQRYDFLTDLNRPLEGERAAGILTVDLLIRKKFRLGDLGYVDGQTDPTGGDLVNLVSKIAPRGWYYLEQLNFCRIYQDQLQGAFDAAKKRVSPSQISSNARRMEQRISGGRLGRSLNAVIHHQVIASLLLPALDKIPMKGALAQTAADQAALACALERYRLAKGQFPENLTALVPQFISQLPSDVITGEPLKYRRTDGSQFVLYSVGWNEKDDGGTIARIKESPNKAQDVTQGDWVWQFPVSP